MQSATKAVKRIRYIYLKLWNYSKIKLVNTLSQGEREGAASTLPSADREIINAMPLRLVLSDARAFAVVSV